MFKKKIRKDETMNETHHWNNVENRIFQNSLQVEKMFIQYNIFNKLSSQCYLWWNIVTFNLSILPVEVDIYEKFEL